MKQHAPRRIPPTGETGVTVTDKEHQSNLKRIITALKESKLVTSKRDDGAKPENVKSSKSKRKKLK
jgi:hypothetical protein